MQVQNLQNIDIKKNRTSHDGSPWSLHAEDFPQEIRKQPPRNKPPGGVKMCSVLVAFVIFIRDPAKLINHGLLIRGWHYKSWNKYIWKHNQTISNH